MASANVSNDCAICSDANYSAEGSDVGSDVDSAEGSGEGGSETDEADAPPPSGRSVGRNGTERWHDEHGLRHRIDLPAVVRPDGTQEWYVHGLRHRIDLPAVTRRDGYRAWYDRGQRHRTDRPAVIYPDGVRVWFERGRPHRSGDRPVSINTSWAEPDPSGIAGI